MEILNSIQKLYNVLKLQSRKKGSFSCEKGSEMIGAIQFGATFDQVSAKYGCQKRTVKNTWHRYLSTGPYEIGTDRDDQRFSQWEAKDELLENIENRRNNGLGRNFLQLPYQFSFDRRANNRSTIH